MHKKKQLPISVLKALEPFMKEQSNLYKLDDPGSFVLRMVDRDPDSDFFFEIREFSTDRGLQLTIFYKPQNRNKTQEVGIVIEPKDLESHFKKWVLFLKEYEAINFFDDPILNQYAEEFDNEVKIVDEDADSKSYDYQTQIWLDEYLNNYIQVLEQFNKPEINSEVVILKEDIIELKETQTKLTKRAVVEKLVKIWAKTRKLGMALIKDAYDVAKKEIFKRLITGKIDDFLS